MVDFMGTVTESGAKLWKTKVQKSSNISVLLFAIEAALGRVSFLFDMLKNSAEDTAISVNGGEN